METLALTAREAEDIRRNRLLEAYKAFDAWDNDALTEAAERLKDTLGISFVQATDVLFDAFWLAGRIRDAG